MPARRLRFVIVFCWAVAAAGVSASVLVVAGEGLDGCLHVAFGVLLVALVLGEIAPLELPLKGDYETVNLSTPFALALLMGVGLGPALVAQAAASLMQDVADRKPPWRSAFNVGQYSLCLMVAAFVLDRLGVAPSLAAGTMSPLTIAAMLAAGVAFFVVNFLVVGIAVASFQGTSIATHLRNDLPTTAMMAAVSISVAPLVLAAVQVDPLLVALFALPFLALHWSGRVACDSTRKATHDALTGLPNRIRFRQLVEEAIVSARPGSGFTVMLLDLDRFKDINDTLGHHYGDLILKVAATRLQEALREGDAIARLGGDEFAILAHTDAGSLAERLGAALRAPVEIGEFVLDVDASIGTARHPEDGVDLETLLRRADMAMYAAKARHLSHAAYTPDIDEYDPARLALVADLRQAIRDEQLVLHYQPLLDLRSGQVRTVEALVRWQHPELGLLQPGEFIELAEHTGSIKPLTNLVLEMALAQCAAWEAAGRTLSVAVNVSARSLVDPALPQSVAAALLGARVAASQLKLEITETAIMVDPMAAKRVLEELNAMGVSLTIDDFGTGYSSLAYLKRLPVGEMKIDRSFVQSMASDPSDHAIVRSVIDLAANLGLTVVAEGVEEAATLEELARLGCDTAQGYFVGRPLPAAELAAWLDQQPRTRATQRSPVVEAVT